MRRKKTKASGILTEAHKKLPPLYSEQMVREVGQAVLDTLVECYQRGDVVDFGAGNTYMKLRKNNTVFSPNKTHSVVFRGDVKSEISDQILDSALKDENLFEMFYTRRGVTEE